MNPDATYSWPDITHPAHACAFSKLGLKKILYIGPWFHIEPTIHSEFKHIKEFIYVDTQPRGENESAPYHKNNYKTEFMEELMKKCYTFGYELIDDSPVDTKYVYTLLKKKQQKTWKTDCPHNNPHLFKFKNKYTNQIIKYYISTNFRYNMNPELRDDMCSADGLIVSGYFPHKDLFQYFRVPKTIIGFTDTVYPVGVHAQYMETDSIMPGLIDDEHRNEAIWSENYYLISVHTTHMVRCNSMAELGLQNLYEMNKRNEEF